MGATVVPENFAAWIDTMPLADPKLIVTGTVEVPTSGWAVALVEANPQGIVPTVLILDLSITRPGGMVLEVITQEPVRFEKPKSSNYQGVTIRHGGGEFTIPVKTVS
ncbi:hypothetical protein [Xanthobacter sp. VNH20]|uniref:hypothetical protein n=1 Tax=Xanthobacter sp. VNH20 TaxID=3156616 RepID=UPI0032B55AF6